jgi:uncharacterized protein (TIGR00297 family)
VAFLTGAIVSLPLAFIVWRRGRITANGAMVGVLLAGVVYAGMYLAGLAVLLAALALTLGSTWIGRERKTRLGIAEDHGGRRGAANVIANCVVGAAAAASEAWTYVLSSDLNAAIFVAGIAAGASDTVASEVGKAWGGRPRSFPAWRAVPAGTPGAISLAGTVAGIVAAALIALPAAGLWLIPPGYLAPIVAACTCGAFIESALATRFEARGIIGNHALNLINTAAAALLALWWCSA